MKIKIVDPKLVVSLDYWISDIISVMDFKNDGINEILLMDTVGNPHVLQQTKDGLFEADIYDFWDLPSVRQKVAYFNQTLQSNPETKNPQSYKKEWFDEEGTSHFKIERYFYSYIPLYNAENVVLEDFPVESELVKGRPFEFYPDIIAKCDFFDLIKSNRKQLFILTTGGDLYGYIFLKNNWKSTTFGHPYVRGDDREYRDVIALAPILKFQTNENVADFHFFDIDKDGIIEFIYASDYSIKIGKIELSGVKGDITTQPSIVVSKDSVKMKIELTNLGQTDYANIFVNEGNIIDDKNLKFEGGRKDFIVKNLPKLSSKVLEYRYTALNETTGKMTVAVPAIKLICKSKEGDVEEIIDGITIDIYPSVVEKVIRTVCDYFTNQRYGKGLEGDFYPVDFPLKDINKFLSDKFSGFNLSENEFMQYLDQLVKLTILKYEFNKEQKEIKLFDIKSLEEMIFIKTEDDLKKVKSKYSDIASLGEAKVGQILFIMKDKTAGIANSEDLINLLSAKFETVLKK